ncbi:MAG: bifunctional anthranilate synthase component I family protein/class IV aminotransferase [Chloroflexota bacterium]
MRFDHLTGRASDPLSAELTSASPPHAAPALDATFGLSSEAYGERVERVLGYLRAGDCYQINLTDAFELFEPGDLLALYLRVRRAQRTSYGAYLDFGNPRIASFSPELHFRVRGNELLTRPMKGTASRGRSLAEDMERRSALATDDKNRAENVMIVDLLRNDMGRLCCYGSVTVPELFSVRPFGKVLQMTSTILGEMAGRPALGEIFAKLFPSGSVTGAPKRRAMQIIRELEGRPRGVYTGAIGYAAPGGDMTFSVAIRTLVASGKRAPVEANGEKPAAPLGVVPPAGRAERALLGVGSGIVVDSLAGEEYRECLLKAAFITEPGDPFELFETMRLEAGRACFAEQHLDRLRGSADYFGFPFDRTEAERLLSARARESGTGIWRLRLSLRHDGCLDLSSAPLDRSSGRLLVGLADERVDSSDPFLQHKTTRRARHDRALSIARKGGLADLLFLNERGELTEGAVSNLFVETGGKLLTPPQESGLLPGVGRSNVLSGHANAAEAILRLPDLLRADAIYLCSALRGMRKAGLQVKQVDA